MPTEEVGEAILVRNIIFWKSPRFPRKRITRIWSPNVTENPYYFPNLSWNEEVSTESIGLQFSIPDCKDPFRKYVRFGVADEVGNEINSCYGEWIVKYRHFRVKELCTLNTWNKYKGRKHIFCEVISNINPEVANTSTETENLSGSEGDEVTKADSDMASADSALSQELKNLRKLSQNLQDLYAGEKHTDVIIKVKEREFKVHKAIISARSTVFDAMFSHELSESNTGLVPIEDCEPIIFEEFLFFVYTGKIQQLSAENVCELYYIADKYQVSELKEECVNFLKTSLTIESISDIICLSTKCNEKDLLDLAIMFFTRNMEDIIVTVNWQLFLKENPIEANELTIKALKLGFTKRKNLKCTK